MLNLNREELSRALNGLSLDDKRELLELLELREQNKPEPVIDNRPTLDELFLSYNDQLAERSGDPDAWRAADEAHRDAYQRHMDRLSSERPRLPGQPTLDLMYQLFRELDALATEAAIADGHPPADQVVVRKVE